MPFETKLKQVSNYYFLQKPNYAQILDHRLCGLAGSKKLALSMGLSVVHWPLVYLPLVH
jgi:hypothetical protein